MKLCKQCGRQYSEELEFCEVDGAELVVVSIGGDNDPMVGQLLDGRFEIETRLGQGGMGTVYRAKQISMGRTVAVKIMQQHLSSDTTAVQRFFREARAASMLSHPNSITTYDFGQSSEGYLYIAMEYLSGGSLSDELEQAGTLTFGQALELVYQVCGSLGEAHDKGIVHRDLKPENLMLIEVEGRKQVKVLDFGIAKLIEGGSSTVTKTGSLLGTPLYMSPEQSKGDKINSKSDIYSIGVMFYEMLFGQTPFDGMSPLEIMVQKIERPTLDLIEGVDGQLVPDRILALLRQTTTGIADERPAAKELQAEIEQLLVDLEPEILATRLSKDDVTRAITVADTSSSPLLRSGMRRKTKTMEQSKPGEGGNFRVIGITAALVLLLGGLLGALIVFSRPDTDQNKTDTPVKTPPTKIVSVDPKPPTKPPLSKTIPQSKVAKVLPKPVVVPVVPAPVVKPKPQNVVIRLVSKPSGAVVYAAKTNEKLGVTPYVLTVKPGDAQKREMIFRLKGYRKEKLDILLDRSKDVVVPLKPVKLQKPIKVAGKKNRPTRKKTKTKKKPRVRKSKFSTNDLK